MQGSEDESVLGTAARPHVGPDATSATSTDGDRRLTADPAPADSVLDNSLSYDLNMSGDGPVASVQQQPGDSLAGIGAGESASTSNDGLMGASRRRTLEPLPSGVQRPQTSPLGRSPLRIDRSGLRSAPIRGAGEDSLNVSNLSSDGLQPGEPLFEDVGEPEEFVYDGVLPDADPSEAYYDDLQQYDIDENAAVGTAVGGMEVQVGVAGAGSDTGPAWYCIKDGFESGAKLE